MSNLSLTIVLGRGLKGKCPNCGEGRLFTRYLKVVPACEACGHDLDQYPADDGPAYLTILLVGHLVIGPLLFIPALWRSSPWVILPVTLIPLTVLVLVVLPRIKGAFIGLLYRLKVSRGDAQFHTADRAD